MQPGRAIIAAVAAFAVALVAGACAGNTRSHPLADWKLYEEPTGLFHFRYPDPPWELKDEPPGAAHLEIQHRGVIDRPMPVELLDVAVAAGPGDLDAFVAGRMSTVTAGGSTLLCDVPPCVPDELETFDGDRALAFSYRRPEGYDAREYYVSGEERIVGVTFVGVRDVTLPEYDVLVETLAPRALAP
ncbi:MAG TPA: hypothetical protein VG389_08825 [Myxococcota bacterium]|nr:hypothetical protein [Myxococcota bacterium]